MLAGCITSSFDLLLSVMFGTVLQTFYHKMLFQFCGRMSCWIWGFSKYLGKANLQYVVNKNEVILSNKQSQRAYNYYPGTITIAITLRNYDNCSTTDILLPSNHVEFVAAFSFTWRGHFQKLVCKCTIATRPAHASY